MTLGDKLKNLRESKDMTQSEMAKLLGVAQSTYSQYEIGDRRLPDDLKIKLADFYKVTVDYLLGREEPNYILAAHRKGGISELPKEAQKELENYVEYLRAKYKK